MNSQLFSYYGILLFVSIIIGFDATIQQFDVNSIDGIKDGLGSGCLAYFADESPAYYVYMEGKFPNYIEAMTAAIRNEPLKDTDQTVKDVYQIFLPNILSYSMNYSNNSVKFKYNDKDIVIHFFNYNGTIGFAETLNEADITCNQNENVLRLPTEIDPNTIYSY